MDFLRFFRIPPKVNPQILVLPQCLAIVEMRALHSGQVLYLLNEFSSHHVLFHIGTDSGHSGKDFGDYSVVLDQYPEDG